MKSSTKPYTQFSSKKELLVSSNEDSQHHSLLFHLHTLWLFTRSDIKTVILPQLSFAIINVRSGRVLSQAGASTDTPYVLRLAFALSWVWLHILVQGIANQRLCQAIEEDRINKPWRPLPSGRLSQDQARRFLIMSICAAFALSWSLDVLVPSVGLMVLIWLYNDLDAGQHFFFRNALNSGGLHCFGLGATLIIAGQSEKALAPRGNIWFALIALIILSTVHLADLEDFEGDSLRGRKTLPIIWGLQITRQSAAGIVSLWSILCSLYWDVNPTGYALIGILGGSLAVTLLTSQGIAMDKVAWKFWCVWMMGLFALPIFSNTYYKEQDWSPRDWQWMNGTQSLL